MPSKQTKKQRREQIRQARIEAQRRRARQRRRKRLLTFGAIAIVAALLASFGAFQFIEGQKTVEARAKEAGCSPIREFPDQGRNHIQLTEPHDPYNSNPPTSGPHSANVPWGVYTDTVEPERLVHNLEHGGTIIHYRPDDLSDDEITLIEDFVDNKFPEGALVNPNPDIPKPIALAAWRNLRTCEKVSLEVIEDFIRKRCNKSPEPGAQCGRLTPGRV